MCSFSTELSLARKSTSLRASLNLEVRGGSELGVWKVVNIGISQIDIMIFLDCWDI